MGRMFEVDNWVHTPQDAAALDPSLFAGAVFDGLGGYEGSEHASALLSAHVTGLFSSRETSGWTNETAYSGRSALLAARKVGPFPQMSAAGVIASLVNDGSQWEITWSGDCRAYVLKPDGWVYPATSDHDLLYDQAMHGRISRGKADGLRIKLDDALSASDAFRLGGGVAKKAFKKNHLMIADMSFGLIETVTVPADEVQSVVLCSDGLHDNLTGLQLRTLIRETPINDLAETLCREAEKVARSGEGKAKPDDITCVVLG